MAGAPNIPFNDAGLAALGFIVVGGLVAVVAAIVLLVRSGRTVSLPLIRWRPHARREGEDQAPSPAGDTRRRPAGDGDRLHQATHP